MFTHQFTFQTIDARLLRQYKISYIYKGLKKDRSAAEEDKTRYRERESEKQKEFIRCSAATKHHRAAAVIAITKTITITITPITVVHLLLHSAF